MGKVTWGGGITTGDIDDAERNQFKPYDGPTPPNSMYAFKVKVLKKGKAQSGNTKLIIGLELVPRRSRPDEKPYKGYFLTESIAVVESQAFKLGPFLDAIGVSSSDFINKTFDDGEPDARGNVKITKIGKWVNDGKTYVLASLADDEYNGAMRKRITNFWPVEELTGSQSDDSGDDSDEAEEEEEPRRKPAKKATPKRREPEPDDEADGDAEEEEETPKRSAKKTAVKKAAPKRRAQEEEEDDAETEDDGEDEAPF